MAQNVQAPLLAVGEEPFAVIGRAGLLTMPHGAHFGEPIEALARRMYRDIKLSRALDREGLALQRQGELALWLSCEGQEGAQVGVMRALRDSDFVFPSYRDHAAALCRGLTPEELLPMWRGSAHSGWDPKDHNFHIFTLVLATQLLHAVGYAMGVKLDGADSIVVAFVGDGALSEGDASEAMNWAAVQQVPLIIFCQNNQWAISTPSAKQFRSPLHERAKGFGLDARHVDGNDALAVNLVMRDAVARVRAGGGPVFLEAVTYRMLGHSSSDDPSRYRPAEEVEMWRSRDPLTRLRLVLDAHHWADAQFYDDVERDAATFGQRVRAACLALPQASLDETFRTMFVAETSESRREREAYRAFQESLA